MVQFSRDLTMLEQKQKGEVPADTQTQKLILTIVSILIETFGLLFVSLNFVFALLVYGIK